MNDFQGTRNRRRTERHSGREGSDYMYQAVTLAAALLLLLTAAL
jgi:hypothetical protein